jgi:phasin family protein
MYTDQIAASSKAGAEMLLGLSKAQFAIFERLSAINMNAARSALEDSAGYTRALLNAKDIQEVTNLNASTAQPVLEKMLSYSRSVYEASTQAQSEISKLLEAQSAEFTRNMASMLDRFAKNAPAGSDVAVAAVKSAMAAANTAYDSFTRVARQASEMAEANLSAAAAAAKQSQRKTASLSESR